MRSTSVPRLAVAAVIGTLSFCGFSCSTKEQVVVEAPPAYQPSQPAPQVNLPKVVAAPKRSEVEAAVARVFKDVAVVDSSHNPSFLVGDFNGDSSQDIAIIIKPAADKLSQINEEFPAWLLRDVMPDKKSGESLRVDKDDILLAIIHGYGKNDWRDDQATQTFLLKHAVGSDMQVFQRSQFQAAHAGRRLPRPQGDLIGEVVGGTSGYLYYARSNYAWYDPKTYKDQSDVGVVHMRSRPSR